jgi:glycosyltransferase involved in cell wall biosynthesis
MNVSVIVACKNREEALKISLASWLNFNEIKEVIIVDWSSDNPIGYLSNFDERIKVIRVNDKKYFNQPQPLNLAASCSSGDCILKLDCDHIINPYSNFFGEHPLTDSCFYTGLNHDNDPTIRYIWGALLVTRENFYKINGYDENYREYYGGEDYNIIQRLRELLGLEMKIFKKDYSLIHLPHGDNLRYKNFEMGEVTEEIMEGAKDVARQFHSDFEINQEWESYKDYYISQYHIKKSDKPIVKYSEFTRWDIRVISERYAEAVEINN